MSTSQNYDISQDEETAEEKAARLGRLEVAALKSKLAATDYIAAKIAEGAATREDYADEISQRAAWRERINELGG